MHAGWMSFGINISGWTGRRKAATSQTTGSADMMNIRIDTMKAVRIHHYGGPEVLQYEDAPRPQPAAGEVLIRVHAAGVNPFDWKVREGYMKNMLPLTLPFIPGWDVSGTVEATGPGATRF